MLERTGIWIKIPDLMAIFPKADILVMRLRNMGYPIRYNPDIVSGDKPECMLVSSMADMCKWCKGKGCVSCSGTGRKDAKPEVKAAVEAPEESPQANGGNWTDVDAQPSMDFGA